MKRYAYQYKLSDNSAGVWVTDIIPKLAGYALPLRFIGRKVIMIKLLN